MNQEEFFNFLITNSLSLDVYGESAWKVAATRARTDNRQPVVFTTANIGGLLTNIDAFESSIRFVIDLEQTPLFGFFGAMRGPTPGHDEMSNKRCLAAGVLTLDSNNTTHVLGLSSESGFFKPGTESLIWILKYLLSANSVFNLSETLAIRSFDENEGGWSTISINVASLRASLLDVVPQTTDFVDGFDAPFASFPEHAVVNIGGPAIGQSHSFDNLIMLDNPQPQVEPAVVPAVGPLPHAAAFGQFGFFGGGLFSSDDESLDEESEEEFYVGGMSKKQRSSGADSPPPNF